jgi:hypothetical protein
MNNGTVIMIPVALNYAKIMADITQTTMNLHKQVKDIFLHTRNDNNRVLFRTERRFIGQEQPSVLIVTTNFGIFTFDPIASLNNGNLIWASIFHYKYNMLECGTILYGLDNFTTKIKLILEDMFAIFILFGIVGH